MNKIIIMGHGNFATGIHSALRLIAGYNDSIIAIDFTEDVTPEMLQVKLKEQINETDNYVIFADLIGGTPFKVASSFYKPNKVEIVAGANLVSLVEVSFNLETDDIATIANTLISTTKENVTNFNLERKERANTSSDGI